jgi:hypothetical protein
MIGTILQNIPLWVWAALLAILVLGLTQTRNRKITGLSVWLLPASMVPISIYAVIASFGLNVTVLGAWAIGVAAAVAANALLFLSPKDVRYSLQERRFELPGSWVPLTVMLAIFGTRLVVGVTTALQPALVDASSFVACVSVVLGTCSGLFLSRAMRTLSARAG